MEKIIDIIDSIAYEKDLNPEDVQSALSEAIIKTAKNSIGEEFEFAVEIDKKLKTFKIFQNIEVIKDEDERAIENQNYVTISRAKDEFDDSLEIGDEVRYELTLENLGRNAINQLYRELEFRIQRLIEQNIFQKYQSKVGKIVFGTVVRVDSKDNTYIEIGEIRATLPRKNRIKGESFRVGDVIKSILKSVRIDRVHGMVIELSRTTPKLLEELLKLEVPEIKDGVIEIVKSARIPGVRAKVALKSNNPAKVDAVGSTVGVKGVRINAVSSVLNGESIDCIEYSDTEEIFISRALSPAIISSVKIEDDKAVVTISKDQKSKAIGREGINIRLAAMLTSYQIELIERDSILSEVKSESKSTKDRGDLSTLESLFKS